VWLLRTSFSWGISRSPWCFIDGYSSSVSRKDVVFLTCSTTFRSQPTTPGTHGEVASVARRRYGMEVEDEGYLKNLVVIFAFIGMLGTI
jgi:hypothetical protein